jgi:hypothetical protein
MADTGPRGPWPETFKRWWLWPLCVLLFLLVVAVTLVLVAQVVFRPGDTGFVSTGTHYVEQSGRLLLSSSYRWAEDEGPGSSSYVSRVDECPS